MDHDIMLMSIVEQIEIKLEEACDYINFVNSQVARDKHKKELDEYHDDIADVMSKLFKLRKSMEKARMGGFKDD